MFNCCPLCASIRVIKNDIYIQILNLQGNCESEVYVCLSCGVRYLYPYITEKQLIALYAKSYFTGLQERKDITGAQEKNTKKAGGEEELVIPRTNIDYSEFAKVRLGKFDETIIMLLEKHPNAKNILDIGAASGDFLALAKKRGLLVSGIEISSYACAMAKAKYGFVFHETNIVEYQSEEKYDLIHMNHVFEHFQFPHQVLNKISALLNQNGLVYVEIPFQFNLIEVLKYHLTKRRKKFDDFSIHHPIFFTPATLKKVFEDNGFNCIKLNVFKFSNYPASGIISQLKRLMWFLLSLVGQGNLIEGVFKKKL
jgi:2-polyprenyl-3-methyl-5-hydroxy-6-metoxy-1,4-benzoquinol methylase